VSSGLLTNTAIDRAWWSGANARITLAVPIVTTSFAMLGLMIGCLIRATAGSIATIVGFTFVFPTAAELARSFLTIGQESITGWRQGLLVVLDILPTTGSTRLTQYDPTAVIGGLSYGPWVGLAVLWGWIIAFAIPALIRLQRRDA
jgi:ABC-2 type transport system permease protein